jgi:hypothetical protein
MKNLQKKKKKKIHRYTFQDPSRLYLILELAPGGMLLEYLCVRQWLGGSDGSMQNSTDFRMVVKWGDLEQYWLRYGYFAIFFFLD